MSKLSDLVPKNKFDTSTINSLMMLSESKLAQILPDLILWIADFNWPIAAELIPILAKYPSSIIPVIKETLEVQQNDTILKYWVISKLIPNLSSVYQLMLIDDIKRIILNPSNSETDEEVVEQAIFLLENIEMLN
ncbi:MAG: DUF5071 domain-containing protein [Defluviitaleaceae bacterium]|nr:DUF5071 domain-containing protein [Defluviitaleaceae bacterium]